LMKNIILWFLPQLKNLRARQSTRQRTDNQNI
jgi:hypothetical protein